MKNEAAMKLSFSISSRSSSSKPKPKPQPSKPYQNNPDDADDEAPQKQFVTEFDSSKPQILPDRPTLTIPPIPNSYQPHKRMKNLHNLSSLSSSDAQLQFETETLGDSLTDSSHMSFGLNIRSRSTAASSAYDDDKSQQPPASTEDVLLQKLKVDLRQLPEDRGLEEFEDMPVESFAKALLSGYGWREGQGVGRNAKEDVKVKQYHKRTGKEGLGFLDLTTSNSASPPAAAVTADSDSSNRSIAVHGAKNDKGDQTVSVEKNARVIGGARRDVVGLKGTVVESLGSNRLVLKVAKTGERVILKASDIADLGSREEEKCLKELEHLPSGKAKVKSSSNGRETSKRDDRERGVAWLRSHIRVRVISKDLKGGRLYRKKGEVVDVVGPYICDVSIDEGRELVEKVDQDFLETALPRRGGPVLVLYGKHKGVYGNLEERDLDREVGVVRDSSTHELLHVKLEQIAEYVGDPSYIGY